MTCISGTWRGEKSSEIQFAFSKRSAYKESEDVIGAYPFDLP